MRMFADDRLDFLQFQKIQFFQPIRFSSDCYGNGSSLSHRGENQTAEATATVAMTTVHLFPIAEN